MSGAPIPASGGGRWDLVVIGGGYWGSAVATLARRTKGWSVCVLDDGDEEGASRASAGYVRWEWMEGKLGSIIPGWWTDEHTAASVEHVRALGAQTVTESVFNYRTEAWKDKPGLLMVNPWEVLAERFTARVRLLNSTPAGGQVVTTGGTVIPARRCLVAAGVWTDDLLVPSGYKPLGVQTLTGSAVIADSEIELTAVETYVTRPYHHVTARPWKDGRVRVGDTVSKTYPDGGLNELISNTERLFPSLSRFDIVTGRRPALPKLIVRELGDGLVVAVGGHRIGLALAGGVAHQVLEVIS